MQQPPQTEATESKAEINLPVDLTVIADSAKKQLPPLNDRLAKQEEETKFKDLERGEDYRTHIHRLACFGLYVIGILVIVMIVIRAWHFLLPENIHWLDQKANQDIERIIFGSVLIGVLGKYFKKFKIIE